MDVWSFCPFAKLKRTSSAQAYSRGVVPPPKSDASPLNPGNPPLNGKLRWIHPGLTSLVALHGTPSRRSGFVQHLFGQLLKRLQ